MVHLMNSGSQEQLRNCDHHNLSNSETNRSPFQRRISHVYPSNTFARVTCPDRHIQTENTPRNLHRNTVHCHRLCLRSKFMTELQQTSGFARLRTANSTLTTTELAETLLKEIRSDTREERLTVPPPPSLPSHGATTRLHRSVVHETGV